MRCSLLTLSRYVDGELDARHRGEVEAHLIGCERCGNGVEHLTEETQRIGELARVHLPDSAVIPLLETAGVIAPGDPLPDLPPDDEDDGGPPLAGTPKPAPPWLGSQVGAALPWRSDRPAPPRDEAGAIEVVGMSSPPLPAAAESEPGAAVPAWRAPS